MIDRRHFVKRTCLGGLALYLDHWATSPAYGQDLIPPAPPIHVNEPAGARRSALGMPGLFPGRVVEIADAQAILNNRVSQPGHQGACSIGPLRELTGAQDGREAWSKFIEPKDIVGIKINPSGAPACCSSPEIVREIVAGVQSVRRSRRETSCLRSLRLRNRYRELPDAGAPGRARWSASRTAS
jgi:hypothetical protein